MKASTLQSRERIAQLKDNLDTSFRMSEEDRVKMQSLNDHLEKARSQLKENVKENVKQLMRYIFPVTCEGHPWYKTDKTILL